MFILLYYFSLVFIVLYYLKPENEKLSKQRKINKPVKHKTPLNLRKMFPRIFLVRLRSVVGCEDDVSGWDAGKMGNWKRQNLPANGNGGNAVFLEVGKVFQLAACCDNLNDLISSVI